MAKPDRILVASPLGPNGSYKLFDEVNCGHVKPGRVPRAGDCNGPEYAQSFTFNYPTFSEVRRRIESHIGKFSRWDSFSRSDYLNFCTEFLKHIKVVMEGKGFNGEVVVLGRANRPAKRAWEFTVTGANYKVDQNFILAKLMGQELFEELIWREACRVFYPNIKVDA